MLATVCLLAMTGGSLVSDSQLESDRIKAVIVGGERTIVLLEESGAIGLQNLPDGLQERVRGEFSLGESYPSDPAAKRLRELVQRATGELGGGNRVLILPYSGDLAAPGNVPYMPNFYRKGDPIPYIPNFFKEGDLDPYMYTFPQIPAPFQFLPPPKLWRDDQMLKGLWDRFGKSPIITPLKSQRK